MHNEIERKLIEADAVTLITDGWTGQFNNAEYLGLGAQLITHTFEKELIIIGMVELENGHSAIETKKAIESMVNKYVKFDKNKIKGNLYSLKVVCLNLIFILINIGIVSDEGSNLVSLFHQLIDLNDLSIALYIYVIFN